MSPALALTVALFVGQAPAPIPTPTPAPATTFGVKADDTSVGTSNRVSYLLILTSLWVFVGLAVVAAKNSPWRLEVSSRSMTIWFLLYPVAAALTWGFVNNPDGGVQVKRVTHTAQEIGHAEDISEISTAHKHNNLSKGNDQKKVRWTEAEAARKTEEMLESYRKSVFSDAMIPKESSKHSDAMIPKESSKHSDAMIPKESSKKADTNLTSYYDDLYYEYKSKQESLRARLAAELVHLEDPDTPEGRAQRDRCRKLEEEAGRLQDEIIRFAPRRQ